MEVVDEVRYYSGNVGGGEVRYYSVHVDGGGEVVVEAVLRYYSGYVDGGDVVVEATSGHVDGGGVVVEAVLRLGGGLRSGSNRPRAEGALKDERVNRVHTEGL